MPGSTGLWSSYLLSFFSLNSFEDGLLDLLPFSDIMQMIRDCSSNELTEMLVSLAFDMDCLEVVCSYHVPLGNLRERDKT